MPAARPLRRSASKLPAAPPPPMGRGRCRAPDGTPAIMAQLVSTWKRALPFWTVRNVPIVQLPDVEVTGYRELADLLRRLITSGAFAPGDRFPSEVELRQQYDLARDTVRLAVAELRYEGLIVVRHGQPTRVRQIYDRQQITPNGIEWVTARMPTPDERREHRIDDGVPVFVLKRVGSPRPEVLPADRWYVGPSVPNER